MLIKVILVLAILIVVTLAVRTPVGARHLALRRIAVVVFAVLAVLSVLFPDTWNDAAELVGVGRGTDLLLYGFIVVFLVSLVTSYRRFREMERSVTLLARRLAVDEVLGRIAEGGTTPSGPTPSGPTPADQDSSTPGITAKPAQRDDAHG